MMFTYCLFVKMPSGACQVQRFKQRVNGDVNIEISATAFTVAMYVISVTSKSLSRRARQRARVAAVSLSGIPHANLVLGLSEAAELTIAATVLFVQTRFEAFLSSIVLLVIYSAALVRRRHVLTLGCMCFGERSLAGHPGVLYGIYRNVLAIVLCAVGALATRGDRITTISSGFGTLCASILVGAFAAALLAYGDRIWRLASSSPGSLNQRQSQTYESKVGTDLSPRRNTT